jgi:hypothetical protein
MNSNTRFRAVTIIALAALALLIAHRTVSGQLSQVADGLNYLKTTQNADGSWGGTAASLNSNLPTTAAALEALKTLEPTTSTNQTSAIQFLASQAVEENPFLSARVIALTGTSGNASADVNALLARQNTDGGWGTAEGFESDTLDTGLALLALKATNLSNPTALTGALNYLTTRQNADGGWALTAGEESQGFYTAIALQALNSCRLQFAISANQSRALAFLRSRQNANGGYGTPSSTAFETAAALLAILGSGQPLTAAETNAINYLSSTQQSNGSWVDDPYSTALALRALAFPRDTDGDGLPDDYEMANAMNPNDPTDAAGDRDSDGLANLEEFRRGTNPNSPDTDADGVDDLTEIANGSNPRDPASHNRPPAISSQPVTAAGEGRPYSYQVQASDPDADAPLAFSFLQSPGGMTISGSGLISWTPGSNQLGSFAVIVKVSDGRGGSALQQYRVSVLAQGVDFAVASVDASAVATDTQTLIIGGTVRVNIANRGGSLFMGNFGALLFEDRNNDGAYQSGSDNLLGSANFAGSIASNASAALDVRVSGVVWFRDNAIYALVDSANQIPELNETNNTGTSASESRYQPPAGEFQPKVKWQYNSSNDGTRVAPVVAPLIDTNGDGRINERDTPAVIIRTDRLTALRGDTGAVIFDVNPPTLPNYTDNLAVGDLDGDGVPEVVVPAFSGGVYCFNNNGNLRWTSPTVSTGSSPLITDLDGDGSAEIIYGRAIFNSDGTLRHATRSPDYRGGLLAASAQVVDLDLDGVPEIVAGPAAYSRDGSAIWYWQTFNFGSFTVQGTLDRGATTITLPNSNFIVGDGYTAIANLDNDANPEVIVVYDGASGFGPGIFSNTVWVFEHDGRIKTGFPVGLYLDSFNQETFYLGPPAVADFDGDGEPEIAISAGRQLSTTTSADASHVLMAVYERDGSLKWRRNMLTVEGALGHGTSPAVAFDFDGDGATEIVYQSSQKLIILNGRDGTTIYEFGVGTNGIAAYSNPVIADVDNDGLAEIIVPNNSIVDGSPQRSGVLVLGDTRGNFRNARRVWNQSLYHITNVLEDAGIPPVAANNWQTFNNSREQSHADGVDRVAAPDLTVSKVTINAQNCPASVGIIARIGNGGSLHVGAGQGVNFYAGDPAAGGALLGTRQTTRALYPGEFEDVTLTGVAPPASQVFVTVGDPLAEPLVQSANLSLLPHTWAQASGYSPNCTVLSNLFAYRGIDGQSNTNWRHNFCNLPVNQHFYEVHFQFPVNATSVTIQNTLAFNTGFLTGTLSFSNGFSTPFTLNANGEGTITFAEQQNVSWIRLTATTTRTAGPSLSEFIVEGSYREPQFRINEGTGRLGNNKAASAPGAATCDPATNQPPVITSAPVITGSLGTLYSYQAQATDANNDPLTFALMTAPAGMTINAIGLINWTPAQTQAGDFAVIVQVSDGRGGLAQQLFTINVTAPAGVNQPPIITSTPAGFVTLGQAYQYDVNATDPDDDVVVFALLAPPAGANLDQLTGLILWTPMPSQVGVQFFTVEAQDGRGGRSLQSFAVEVRPATILLPPPPPDRDSDGFDETEDCNDTNPNVNPGRAEIPNNGLDDDCNPSTPDTLPANSVACSIASDKRNYNSNSLAQLTLRVRNLSAGSDITGLQAQVTVSDPAGQSVLTTTLNVGPLPANGHFKTTLVFNTQNRLPGIYRATLDLRFGASVVCGSQISFAILSSAAQGKALVGSISASPAQIARGSNATFTYQVSNIGNVDLSPLNLKILVVEVSSGIVAQSLTDQTALVRGQSFTNSQTFNSVGVNAGDYLVILQGESGGISQTVSSAFLKITATSDSAPDCRQARPNIATLWPPDHRMVAVSILGVTDPDGDAVTIRIDRIMQDEPTNGLGDGDTCADAQGIGTSTAQLRVERSGNGNGRVYTIFFTATDASGASCQGSVKVCVPHNQNQSCVDDGPTFNSTVCSPQ